MAICRKRCGVDSAPNTNRWGAAALKTLKVGYSQVINVLQIAPNPLAIWPFAGDIDVVQTAPYTLKVGQLAKHRCGANCVQRAKIGSFARHRCCVNSAKRAKIWPFSRHRCGANSARRAKMWPSARHRCGANSAKRAKMWPYARHRCGANSAKTC